MKQYVYPVAYEKLSYLTEESKTSLTFSFCLDHRILTYIVFQKLTFLRDNYRTPCNLQSAPVQTIYPTIVRIKIEAQHHLNSEYSWLLSMLRTHTTYPIWGSIGLNSQDRTYKYPKKHTKHISLQWLLPNHLSFYKHLLPFWQFAAMLVICDALFSCYSQHMRV